MTSSLSPDRQRQVREAIADIEAAIDALPAYSSANGVDGARARDDYRAAVKRTVELLREQFPHGLIDDRPSWEGSRVKIYGIQSTSTSGSIGALRNWCTAARKRLDA